MRARDDYPIQRNTTLVTYTIDPGRWQDMCDEIDQLRADVAGFRALFVDVERIKAEVAQR